MNTEQYISVCSLFDPIFPETDSGFAGGGMLMIIFIHRYASAVYAMGLCLSVCLCLSQVGVLLKWLNVGSKKQTTRQPTDSSFPMPKISTKFNRGKRKPLRGRQMQVGWVKIGDFRQITGYISKTVQDRRTLSIQVE